MARQFLNGIDSTNNRIVNVASPTAGTDAANKAYVDALAAGLEWKQEVRAATTTNGTLATAYTAGSVIDTYTLVLGDRILLKNQTTQTDNGIYVVTAGTPTRSTDANTSTSLNNATVLVTKGGQANTAWTQTAADPTIGTTNIVFAQFGAGTTYTAGNGLQLVSTAFSVLLNGGANSGLTSTGSGLAVNPGTGIVTSGGSTAVDFTVVPKKFAVSIGNASLTTFTVTHNLGTLDVIVQVYDNGTTAQVETDVLHATTNTLTLNFSVAPTSNQYRVVVMG